MDEQAATSRLIWGLLGALGSGIAAVLVLFFLLRPAPPSAPTVTPPPVRVTGRQIAVTTHTGAPAADLAVTLTQSSGAETRTTNASGHAAFVDLRDGEARVQLPSPWVPMPGFETIPLTDGTRSELRVHPLCPGWVRIEGAPAGRIQDPVFGWKDLVDGTAMLEGRRCGESTVRIKITTDAQPRFGEVTLQVTGTEDAVGTPSGPGFTALQP